LLPPPRFILTVQSQVFFPFPLFSFELCPPPPSLFPPSKNPCPPLHPACSFLSMSPSSPPSALVSGGNLPTNGSTYYLLIFTGIFFLSVLFLAQLPPSLSFDFLLFALKFPPIFCFLFFFPPVPLPGDGRAVPTLDGFSRPWASGSLWNFLFPTTWVSFASFFPFARHGFFGPYPFLHWILWAPPFPLCSTKR